MAYLGKSPSQGVRNRYYFTASGGETSISGALTGGTLTFTDGNYVDVNLNGVTLVAGTDYNTSTANTIAGLSALTASDVVEIVVYDVFSVFSGNVNSDFSVGGNLSVTGTTAFTGATTITGLTTTGDINFGDNDKAIFGAGSDLQIYHDGSNSYISEGGTGNLFLGATNLFLRSSTGETYIGAVQDGAVTLYHDNAAKLATTADGVDITGDTAITGHASIGVDAIDSTRALTVAGATDGSGSSILVCYNSSLAQKFAVRDDGLVSAAGSVDITGNIDFSGGILASNGSVQFVMDKDNNGGEVFVWGHNAANATTNELMRLTSAGLLGIGTAAPAAPIDIAITSNQGLLIDATSGNNAYLTITNNGSNSGAKIGFDNASNAAVIGHHTYGNIIYANSSGNVGIGRVPATGILDLQCGNTTALQAIRIADTSPTEYFGVFNANEGGNAPNAANATLKVRGMKTTNRAINAGGTVNASGADYAEYMIKADGVGTIAKGAVCGVDANGKLTDVFANAHSFVIKSTDPSYVGGDVWSIASTDADGNQTTLEGDALEAARQKVDRIAFSGQVPCTISGTTEVGDFVIAQATSDGGIEAVAVTSPTFEQYSVAIGKVWKLGSSQHTVAVKIG